MIEGILFLLIVINFALTLTLYIQYNKNKTNKQEIKKEMTNIVNNFNKNAERNIQILEDRINKIKILLKQYKQNEKNRIITKPNNINYKSQSPKDKINSIINKSAKEMKEYTGSLKTNYTKENQLINKTYIQKAYNPIENKPLNKKEPFQPLVNNNIINSNLFKHSQNNNNIQNNNNLEEELFNGPKKDTTHKIAKLIGEGKSLEDISNTLGVSLGEIKLFTSLFRKRVLENG